MRPPGLDALPDDALSRLVANCVFEAVRHGPRRAPALAKLHRAYPEIERRSARLDDKGLLALLGYRVGHREGMAEERRRAVLTFVHQYPLPRVRDARYMARWGEPGSECRRKQIEGVLEWFLRQHRGEPLLARACAEWAADLEFVRSPQFPESVV
jgi:hypothetical protein